MEGFAIAVAALAAVWVALFGLWLVSLALRDASIVDIAWGPGFAGVAWLTNVLAETSESRALLGAGLTSLWGLRLGAYLLWRNAGHGEDKRYQAMRRAWGGSFGWVSLFTVFLFQGLVMWVVSMPVYAVQISPGAASLGALDALGVLVFAAGFVFESVGDWQLARFRRDPANAGRVMDRGLWAWTRHPNYFGDFLVWWGLFALALAAGHAWTLAGPALMSFFLIRVSGVPLLERGLTRSRPGYAEYVARTSGFFPRPPRRDLER